MSVQTMGGVFPELGTPNKYIEAAKEQLAVLSFKIHTSFSQMAQQVETSVKPVFQAVAYPVQYFTDKLARVGKGGQAPFPQVGMLYDAYNGAKKAMTKIRSALRVSQLREATKFVYN